MSETKKNTDNFASDKVYFDTVFGSKQVTRKDGKLVTLITTQTGLKLWLSEARTTAKGQDVQYRMHSAGETYLKGDEVVAYLHDGYHDVDLADITLSDEAKIRFTETLRSQLLGSLKEV